MEKSNSKLIFFLKRIWIIAGIFLAFVFMIGTFIALTHRDMFYNAGEVYFTVLIQCIFAIGILAIGISIPLWCICGSILLIRKVAMKKDVNK